MAKVLAKNGEYTLLYDSARVNRYIVYRTCPSSPSGDLKINQMVGQSSVFTAKLKSYFTPQQVQTAIAKVHAAKYVGRKFKA